MSRFQFSVLLHKKRGDKNENKNVFFFFIFKERMMDVLINEPRALSVGLHMEHISGSEKKTE